MAQLLIWDTDLDSDCDDLAATALIVGFVKAGEAKLLAATVASENVYAAPAMRALLNDAGLSGSSVGAYKGSAIDGPTTSLYARQIASRYGDASETRSNYPDAVETLRQALAAAPDGSVKIVTGGTLTNIAALLKSPPDSISPLSGLELVALKVQSIHSMGGDFASANRSENNVRFDIEAANHVAATSPVTVVWSGHEVGNTIKTTIPIMGAVDTAFELGWSLSGSQLAAGQRPSWDLTAIEHAVRGSAAPYAVGAANGTLFFDANAYTRFTADAGGRNAYLVKTQSDATIASGLNAVIASGALGVNRPPTGELTLLGTAVEDGVLTVASSIVDPDGAGALTYQWLRDGSAIAGATGLSYTLGQTDVGAGIAVAAQYVDGRGNAETVASNRTAAVANVNDPPGGLVTISGDLVSGSTLFAANTLSDEDGLGRISYQWLRDGTAIASATGSTYTLAEADIGRQVSVRASYVDGQGAAERITSTATAAIAAPPVIPVYQGGAADDVFAATTPDDWTISGFGGNDRLGGGSGSDLIDGGSGADDLSGKGGNDTFVVDSGGDVVREEADQGFDVVRTSLRTYTLPTHVEALVYTGPLSASLSGNSGANTIKGGAAGDVLNGAGGDDVLEGSGGDDRLDGGSGADHMVGGAGGDVYVIDTTRDMISEAPGGGHDRVFSSADVILAANVEDVALTGSAALAVVGNDLDNRIVANLGRNRLTGGEGADTFVFGVTSQLFPAYATGNSATTRDVILDFRQGVDRIDLSSIDASVRNVADYFDNDAFTSVSAARSFSADSAGTLIYFHEQVNGTWITVVAANTDKDVAAEFQIELTGLAALGLSDFVP